MGDTQRKYAAQKHGRHRKSGDNNNIHPDQEKDRDRGSARRIVSRTVLPGDRNALGWYRRALSLRRRVHRWLFRAFHQSLCRLSV
jgi:hypothetical protein